MSQILALGIQRVVAPTTTTHLRLISGGKSIVIPATDGTRTLAQASDVFTGCIDSNHVKWGLDVPQSPTTAMSVEVFEQTRDGTFANIFDSMRRSHDQMCFRQNQIVVFCKKHRNRLPTDGYSTFFLFKEDGKYFVARVYFVVDDRLKVRVDLLSSACVWLAEYRHCFVVPQLTA